LTIRSDTTIYPQKKRIVEQKERQNREGGGGNTRRRKKKKIVVGMFNFAVLAIDYYDCLQC